jgi:hypothetical protein
MSALKRLDNLTAGARARAAAAAGQASSIAVIAADEVAAGALTGTTTSPIEVAAFDVTPSKGGLYLVNFTADVVLSAADTLTWQIIGVEGLTSITGGAALRQTFHYETTGSALVVTGTGSTVEQWIGHFEVATGQIAAVNFPISAVVQLGGANGTRQAILVAVTTAGGAHLTTLNITNAGAIEI